MFGLVSGLYLHPSMGKLINFASYSQERLPAAVSAKLNITTATNLTAPTHRGLSQIKEHLDLTEVISSHSSGVTVSAGVFQR